MALSAGATLGTYEVVAPLGKGGMGEVYLARDTRLGREVAIKVLPADRVGDDTERRRFVREARLASSLNHPAIITIHEIGSAGDVDFIVMEYVPGASLNALIPPRGMPLEEVLRIAMVMADGLARAHARGIVHRDIKPANVIIGADGVVKILDFGLARVALAKDVAADTQTRTIDARPSAVSQAGSVSGTIGYMSPEQATGRAVDHRSDIFSFGALLYEMVTGRRAFDGGVTAEVVAAILKDDPTPPGRLAAAPPALDALVLRCLEKDPDRRFQSMDDVKHALRAVQLGPASASNVRWRGWAAAAAATAVIAAAAALSTWGTPKPPSTVAAGARIESIAVLPFVNDSADSQLEYLSDGLTESLINSFARLQRLGPLRIVPRSTVFAYKGKITDVYEVGRALDVRAVVTGRVMRRGDALVVSAELVDLEQRSQLWGDQYNRKADDLLQIQSDIANEIAGRLRVELTGDQRQRLMRGGTASVEAYDLYLKGLYHSSRPRLAGMKEAVTYFERASLADPGFALPHAHLSNLYGTLGYLALGPTQSVWPKAKAEAQRALALDPELAPAHAALGHAVLFYEWDWARAREELDRAITLDPNHAPTYHWYAHYWMTQNNWDKAIDASRKAVELEPSNMFLRGHLLYFLAATRRSDELIEEGRKAAELDRDFWVIHTGTGLAALQQRRLGDAITLLEKAHERSGGLGMTATDLGYAYALGGQPDRARKVIASLTPQGSSAGHSIAVPVAAILAGLGEKDLAFRSLEGAYRDRDPMLLFLKAWYWFDNLRGDPRYEDLVRRIGLK